MDGVRQIKRTGNEAGDEKRLFCSSCAAEPAEFLSLLDTRSGKQHRLFRCECGALIWDDKAVYI
jgi:hypothetical protein